MNRKKLLVMIAVSILVIFAFTFTACISIDPLDEVENNSNSNNNDNLPLEGANGNNYDVITQVGTPVDTSTSLTEVVARIQTSVVIINTDKGSGSGVFYGKIADEDASLIATCCHVIDDASTIEVTLNDGDIDASNDVILNATLIGMDDDSDLAVLKVSGSNYNYVSLRDTDESKIQLAEEAIAIGNPLGAGISVTVGHISGVSKTINMDGVNMTLLQTDAAVNSGNSGGALFDRAGYLIGIVNAKSTGDTVEGMGYAIPVYDVIDICNSLIKTAGNPQYNGLGYIEGKIRLGVVVQTFDRDTLSKLDNFSAYLPAQNEFYYYISENYTINQYGSVALSDADGKIKQNMLITGITLNLNGTPTKKAFSENYELADFLATAKVGDTVTMHLIAISTQGTYFNYTYVYTPVDVEITMHQYVYGYKG